MSAWPENCPPKDLLNLTEVQAREICLQGTEAIVRALLQLAALAKGRSVPETAGEILKPSSQVAPYENPAAKKRPEKRAQKKGHKGARRTGEKGANTQAMLMRSLRWIEACRQSKRREGRRRSLSRTQGLKYPSRPNTVTRDG
ncbi:hypothetical protein HQ520_18600 [bacterium]|nr:hypothetical protein [bacterium]